MNCRWHDCFTCPYPDCVWDETGKPKNQTKKDKAEYMHQYYLKKKAEKAQRGE